MLETFFPPCCLACDAVLPAEVPFCASCAAQNEPLPAQGCGRCGEPGQFPSGLCRRCRARLPAFLRAWAPLEHVGPLARAIHRFKYEDLPQLALPLAALWRAAPPWPRRPTVVVPVPLHARRYRERGFDQACLLASAHAAQVGLPLRVDLLRRVAPTQRQVGLSDAQRVQNLAGAFHASPRASGAHVLLLDDVLTTGATVDSAAQALRGAGAHSVQVLTLARARREDS